ncbi:iron ABC transporter permease [Ignatzschineria larvae DSM 13226]|uniref:Iron ABC transporter permease n=1 Tax=Ignatzschineria larvae DSM 13226 TaxID=1111732 RepID=A0ABZ3C3V6_9GAMM
MNSAFFEQYQKPIILSILCGLVIILLTATWQGAMEIRWENLFDSESIEYYIIWQIRIPRTLAALLVGGGLAISGAIMQGLFRNPLVEPGIIGVSSGAGLFAALAIVLGVQFLPSLFAILGDYALPLAACLGGWVVTSILYLFSRNKRGISISSMLLIGIAINAFTGALIGLLTFIADETELRSLTFWTMGSLSSFNYEKIAIIAVVQLIFIPLLCFKARAMNAMLLGEREAKHLGIEVEKLKRMQIWGVAIITGSAVAFAGGIGFIGLLIPHLIRMLFGSDNRFVLPLSYLFGGILLIVADLFSRTLAAPSEIPIGILTAFIGAPFLAYLVYKQGRS